MTVYKDIEQTANGLITGPTDGKEPGVYIQGDHAIYYAVMLIQVLGSYGRAENEKDIIALNAMGDLVTLLQSIEKE